MVSEIIVEPRWDVSADAKDERKNFGGMGSNCRWFSLKGESPRLCKVKLYEETGISSEDFIEVGRILHKDYQTTC